MAITFFPHNIYAQLFGFIMFAALFYILSRHYSSKSKKPNKLLVIAIGLIFCVIGVVSLIFSIFFFQYTEANLILRLLLGIIFLMSFLTFFLLGIVTFFTLKSKK